MIRELLTPEAQADAYVWAAVLLAHAALGAAGWAVVGWAAVAVYLAIPGAVHPPVCMGVVAKSDLGTVAAPLRAMVMLAVQPLPEEVWG